MCLKKISYVTQNQNLRNFYLSSGFFTGKLFLCSHNFQKIFKILFYIYINLNYESFFISCKKNLIVKTIHSKNLMKKKKLNFEIKKT